MNLPIEYDKSRISEQKFAEIFQHNPNPSYIWRIVEKDLILIDYNIEAEKITEGQIKNYLGTKASEMYKDQKEFINGMNQCIITRNYIIKEIESFSKTDEKKKISAVAFNFIPPDLVIVISEDITSYKQIKDKLKKREDQLKDLEHIVNHSPAVIFLWCNAEGWPVEFVSENVNQFGYKPEDFYSNRILYADIVYPEDLKRVAAEVSRYSQEGLKEFVQEYRIITKSGEVRCLDDRTWIRRNSQGEITHYQGIIIDITTRKLAEYQSIKEKKKAELYLDLAGVIIIALNKEGKIFLMNKKGYELLEYQEGELIGKNWFEICVSKNKKKEAYEIFKRLIYGDFKPMEFYESPIITRNNKEKILVWHTALLYDNDKKIVGILSSGEDITDLKNTELKLKKSEEELRKLNLDLEQKVEKRSEQLKESEEKYRLITENAYDLIALVNQKYEHEFINEQTYTNILGYSKEDMLGKTRFEIIHPDDLERGIKAYKNGLLIGIGSVELQLRHKQGHYLWFEFKGKKYQDTKGNLMGLLVGREITERKKAEQLIIEENKKLLELDKTRKDIITRVSHELKTPLTSAFLASDLLVNTPKEKISEEVLRYSQILHRNHIRLKSLIKNILDVSKIDFGKLDLIRIKENLIEIISESMDQLSLFAENRQIKINLDLPETIFCNVDKSRIEQVITNILSNAIKNTQKNGEIYISAIENMEYIDIKIKDTGVGLTSKEMERLFTRFGKIERYGQGFDIDIEGVGLGLYISKYIVELHNGQILIESEGRNKGATFIIRLFKNK